MHSDRRLRDYYIRTLYNRWTKLHIYHWQADGVVKEPDLLLQAMSLEENVMTRTAGLLFLLIYHLVMRDASTPRANGETFELYPHSFGETYRGQQEVMSSLPGW